MPGLKKTCGDLCSRVGLEVDRQKIVFVPESKACSNDFGTWCNGNTSDSGSDIHGSNPCVPVFQADYIMMMLFL